MFKRPALWPRGMQELERAGDGRSCDDAGIKAFHRLDIAASLPQGTRPASDMLFSIACEICPSAGHDEVSGTGSEQLTLDGLYEAGGDDDQPDESAHQQSTAENDPRQPKGRLRL